MTNHWNDLSAIQFNKKGNLSKINSIRRCPTVQKTSSFCNFVIEVLYLLLVFVDY